MGFVGIWSRTLLPSEAQHLHERPNDMLTRRPTQVAVGAAAPVGAIMNQLQSANLGADLYNGTLIA